MTRRPGPLDLRTVFLWWAAALAVTVASHASEPWWEQPAFSVPGEPLLESVGRIEAPAGAPVHMLLFETEYTLGAPGVTRTRERQVYRVESPDGVRGWSTLESAWSPTLHSRPRIRARVVTPDGLVHVLDPDTVQERAGDDPEERVLQARLPAVAPGAVVEIEIVSEPTERDVPAGEARRHWLAMAVPVHRSRVVLDAPADLPVRFRTALMSTPEPTVTHQGDRIRRTFTQERVDALESIDPGWPPDVPLAPYVAFSTGSSWPAVAGAYSEWVDGRLAASDLSGPPSSGPDEPAGASQWERIRELLQTVHGVSGDRTVLLTGLLRREGIPAYVALVRRGFGPDVEADLPGLGPFNHSMVYVPGGSPLWIDPTDPFTPMGSVPLPAAGRWALVASPNTRGLVRTPEAAARDHRVLEERKIYLADHGPGRVVENSEMEGNPAREVRRSWASASRREISDLLTEYVESTYGAKKLSLFDHSSLTDPAQPLQLHLEAEEAAYAVTDADEGLVVLAVDGLFQRLPEILTRNPGAQPDRSRGSHDLFLYEPHHVTWRYEIHVPEGLVLRRPPDDVRLALGPLRYVRSLDVSEDGRRLTVTLELDTGSRRRYTPRDVLEIRRSLSELPEVREGALLLRLDRPGAEPAPGPASLATLTPKSPLPRLGEGTFFAHFPLSRLRERGTEAVRAPGGGGFGA